MTRVCDVLVAALVVVGVLVWAGSTLLRHADAGAEFEGVGRRKRCKEAAMRTTSSRSWKQNRIKTRSWRDASVKTFLR
jgi:hypothetical protein